MRPTRVLYVENDPALLGIMATLLGNYASLELTLACSDPQEALASPEALRADVALIDLALGPGVMNGIDLGIALRGLNPHIGIVLHSQYPLDVVINRVPAEHHMGWSTMKKRADLDLDEVVELLRSTARGMSVREESTDGATLDEPPSPLGRLSAQQRAIIALAASGMSGPQIGARLGMSQEAVRKELARVYRVLAPEGADGGDRRTQAVLAYLQLTRAAEWDEQRAPQ